MPRAEFPIVLAGGVAIASGMAKEGKWPANGVVSIIGTSALVLVASLFHNSKAAPLIAGIAWLFAIAVLIKAVPGFHTAALVGKATAPNGIGAAIKKATSKVGK